MNESSQRKLFDIMAEAFQREGVTDCFALLGDANMKFATRLAEQDCQMIYVRHEHCAVAAAMAYARKTGKPGVATVTCGPAVTQLMTALPAAVRAHLPVVVLAGEAPLKSGWYNQEIDQAPLVTATGAAYRSLHFTERFPVEIRDAFLQAKKERRPVVLGVPFDLQNRPWEGPLNWPDPSDSLLGDSPAMPPSPAAVDTAVGVIEKAKRIVVLAGLGAVESEAADACKTLAGKLGGFLATTLPARGLFHDDPYCLGLSGSFTPPPGLELLKEADLVIAVGCSLAFHAGGGGQLWPGAEILQVDINPSPTSQGQQTARYRLQADARLGVEALVAQVKDRSDSWRSEEWAKRIRETPPDDMVFDIEPGLLDPRDVVDALEQHLPMDWELVNSSGHCSHFFAHMPSRPQSRFLTIREFGAIGNGTSFAMGVAAARPDSPVALFDGDGSVLMHVQELETMVRHGMKILIVVMNDGTYGSEIHKLRSEGMSDEGAVFGYTDLAAVARGFGLNGHRVTDLSQIPGLVAEFASGNGPALWDCQVSDKVVSPVLRRAHG